jgi:RNA polymerase sigma-70 factor (ECF subfamily)
LTVERYQFDGEYVRRLTAGDAETERHFTRYFGELLTLKLRPRLKSPAVIEDAKQETFLRVLTTLRNKGGLATPESLGSFVNSVCNNVLFETYRSQARLAPLPAEAEEERIAEGTDAEGNLVQQEEQARVRQVLSELPEKDQQLLRWLFFDECDKDEICRRLNIDRNYLRVLVHRAKARFREGLQRHERAPV